jgi:hypothetical protein
MEEGFISLFRACHSSKLDMPKPLPYRTPILEWYVVRCGSKNKYLKDMCIKKIGLHVQIVITTLGSIVNIIKETYMTTS